MTRPASDRGSSGVTLAASAFRHYAADLHRFLRKRLRDPQKADDVAQEVFSRLVRVQKPKLIKKPQAYLFGIAFHVIREERLQDEREPVAFDSQAAEQAAEHPHVLARDELADRLNLRTQLERAISELPELHRALVLMCKRDGLTYE